MARRVVLVAPASEASSAALYLGLLRYSTLSCSDYQPTGTEQQSVSRARVTPRQTETTSKSFCDKPGIALKRKIQ